MKADTKLWGCDKAGCSEEEVSPELPLGWFSAKERVGPCGLTNYYRSEVAHFCPKHKPVLIRDGYEEWVDPHWILEADDES